MFCKIQFVGNPLIQLWWEIITTIIFIQVQLWKQYDIPQIKLPTKITNLIIDVKCI